MPAMAGGVAGPYPLGALLLVRYNLPVVEDHERLVIGHIDGTDYIIIDPDTNIYEEGMVADGHDLLAVWVVPVGGGMPFGHPMDGAYSHQFATAPSAAQLNALLITGQGEANVVRASRQAALAVAAGAPALGAAIAPLPAPAPGLVLVGGGPPVGPMAAAVAPVAPPPAAVVLPIAGPAPVVGAAMAGGHGPAGAGVPGGGLGALHMAIHGGAGGWPAAPSAPAGVGPAAGLAAPVAVAADGGAAPVSRDLRVQPVRYNELEQRVRDPREALTLCSTVTFPDFPIVGPRSALWVVTHCVTVSGSCRAWHQQFKAIARVTDADDGITMHGSCCEILHFALVYDQLNIGNSAALEATARELQTLELRYQDRIVGAGYDHSERSILSGSQTIGNLCIMPEIREFLRDALRVKNDIDKERRKAREERNLQKPKNQKKGKQGEAE